MVSFREVFFILLIVKNIIFFKPILWSVFSYLEKVFLYLI